MIVLLLGYVRIDFDHMKSMYGLVFCIIDTMQWCIVVDVSIYKTNDVHNKVKGFLKSHFTPPTLDSGIDIGLIMHIKFLFLL